MSVCLSLPGIIPWLVWGTEQKESGKVKSQAGSLMCLGDNQASWTGGTEEEGFL